MGIRNRKTPLEKEWDSLCKKEQAFLARGRSKKGPALNRLLADKAPEKLRHALDAAFEKAFLLIFEKGTGLIEKTYSRESLEQAYKINFYADELRGDRKSLRAFSKGADRTGAFHLLLSGGAGVGMGLLGIGLPDVPLFTGMVLKCVYEIALQYGFEYDSEPERYFILLLIEGAVSRGDRLMEADRKIEAYSLVPGLPEGCPLAGQAAATGAALSEALLNLKFLQGIPIVGAVGGAGDAVYMKRISEYANIKYRKRFLRRRKNRKGLQP